MNIDELDIDWNYLLERLEDLLDLGEETLERRLIGTQPDPELFRDCIACRWQGEREGGALAEIPLPDLPAFDDLQGISRQLERLRRNTLQFVRGHPANNLLLVGEMGCGKTSAIRGLLQEFAPRGLRLVEVKKRDLRRLGEITGHLRSLPYRFILFCSDLPLHRPEDPAGREEPIFEGGMASSPDNVLVYATCNRPPRTESRAVKTRRTEIPPIAAPFGIILEFPPLSRNGYLSVVRHLASRGELQISPAKLERAALAWSRERGSRSGLVARQFIDDLSGQTALRGGAATGGGELPDK